MRIPSRAKKLVAAIALAIGGLATLSVYQPVAGATPAPVATVADPAMGLPDFTTLVQQNSDATFSSFAQSNGPMPNFKLPIQIRIQSQPVQDVLLYG